MCPLRLFVGVCVLALLVCDASAVSTNFKRAFGKAVEECGCECPCHCCATPAPTQPPAIAVPEGSLRGDFTSNKTENAAPKEQTGAAGAQNKDEACFGLGCQTTESHPQPHEQASAAPSTVTLPNGITITTQSGLPASALQPGPSPVKIGAAAPASKTEDKPLPSDREVENTIKEAEKTADDVQSSLDVSPKLAKDLAVDVSTGTGSSAAHESHGHGWGYNSGGTDAHVPRASVASPYQDTTTAATESPVATTTDATATAATTPVHPPKAEAPATPATEAPAPAPAAPAPAVHTPVKEESTAAPTVHPTAAPTEAPTPAPATLSPTPEPVKYAQCFPNAQMQTSVQGGIKQYEALLGAIPQGQVLLKMAKESPVCPANTQPCLNSDTQAALKTFESQLPAQGKELLKTAPVCK